MPDREAPRILLEFDDVVKSFGGVLAASLAVGLGCFAVAITVIMTTVLSDYPPGPIIVLTMFAVFLAVWLFRHLVKPKVITTPAAPPTFTPGPGIISIRW